jgi:protein-S-isoprenylcysteine O-methyltransferase
VNTVSDLAWGAFALVWIVGSFANKKTLRGMPAGALILHVALLAVAFDLLLVGWIRRAIGPRLLPESEWLDLAASAMQVIGLGFAIWARLHIGRNWSGTVELKEGHALVRSGPYALVRHPIYTGLLLAVLGKAVEHADLAGLMAFALLAFEWKRKSLLEERVMVERFGAEYEEYRREVKGLVPGIW